MSESDIEFAVSMYATSKDARIAQLEAERDRLRTIRCPDGKAHRWGYDGQCEACANYATDLIDAALAADQPKGDD